MNIKHDLKHLAWVYNQVGENKLTLLLYHRVLASLLIGKKVENGVKYGCFISANDLMEVDPEFNEIDTYIKEKQWKLKIKKLLNEIFEGEFTVSMNGYCYYEKIIVDGIGISYTVKD